MRPSRWQGPDHWELGGWGRSRWRGRETPSPPSSGPCAHHHHFLKTDCTQGTYLSVSVSLGRHNKVPQAGWLKQQNCPFLTVLGAGSLKSSCPQRWSLLRPLPLACRSLLPPLFSQALTSVCVCALIFSYKNTSHLGSGPTISP